MEFSELLSVPESGLEMMLQAEPLKDSTRVCEAPDAVSANPTASQYVVVGQETEFSALSYDP